MARTPTQKFRKFFQQRFASPLLEFIHDSRAVGIVLLLCTIIALVVSNTAAGSSFIIFWEKERHVFPASLHLPHSLLHWINDGLMTLFFLLAGMEIKRELWEGELAGIRKAVLPAVAALGGMLFPALLYLLCTQGSGQSGGWGIPMATDIAFSLGILSLLGSRAPVSLKILLTALAIIDDLGAIIAIALFYSGQLSMGYLLASAGLFVWLLVLNKAGVRKLYLYLLTGLALWYCLLQSGVHATLAGVLLGLALPLRQLPGLEHRLHDPVSFMVLPLFALANTAIRFPVDAGAALASPLSYGILAGLVAGKPLGIFLSSKIAVKTGLAQLPEGLRWRHIGGMGLLAGIGFTMSIFIALLAFEDEASRTTAKIAVLLASLVSGIAGFAFLRAQGAARKPTGDAPGIQPPTDTTGSTSSSKLTEAARKQ